MKINLTEEKIKNLVEACVRRTLKEMSGEDIVEVNIPLKDFPGSLMGLGKYLEEKGLKDGLPIKVKFGNDGDIYRAMDWTFNNMDVESVLVGKMYNDVSRFINEWVLDHESELSGGKSYSSQWNNGISFMA